jgi:hypothetical protein
MTLHSRALKAERDAKIAEIDYMAREAETFRSRSESIARQINDEHKAMVESARKTAYANYLKKYGDNRACGISVRLPNVPTGIDQADSAGQPDEPQEREFVSACAIDAAITEQWKQWAIANQLEVQ